MTIYNLSERNPLNGWCPWDINADGLVDTLDVGAFMERLNQGDTCWLDLNDDGMINDLDMAEIVANFNACQ